MLAQGLSDTHVASQLGINRRTINRWRLYDPLFCSRLNRIRKAIWANTIDHLRAMLPRSLRILSAALRDQKDKSLRVRAAIQLLKIAGASKLAPRTGPDSLYEALLERVNRERASEMSPYELRQTYPPQQWELDKVYEKLLEHIAEADGPEYPEDCS